MVGAGRGMWNGSDGDRWLGFRSIDLGTGALGLATWIRAAEVTVVHGGRGTGGWVDGERNNIIRRSLPVEDGGMKDGDIKEVSLEGEVRG